MCKVDIQGAEKLVIQGGTLALSKIRLLYIEVLFERLYAGCAEFPELDFLLRSRGYKLSFFNDFRQNTQGDLAYANAVYRNLSWSPT